MHLAAKQFDCLISFPFFASSNARFVFALYDNHFKRSAFRETFELPGFILMVWYFFRKNYVFLQGKLAENKSKPPLWVSSLPAFITANLRAALPQQGLVRMCIRRRARIILVRRPVNKALVVFLGFLSLWALLESCCSSAKLNQYKQQTATHTDSERENAKSATASNHELLKKIERAV